MRLNIELLLGPVRSPAGFAERQNPAIHCPQLAENMGAADRGFEPSARRLFRVPSTIALET